MRLYGVVPVLGLGMDAPLIVDFIRSEVHHPIAQIRLSKGGIRAEQEYDQPVYKKCVSSHRIKKNADMSLNVRILSDNSLVYRLLEVELAGTEPTAIVHIEI